MPNFYMPKWLGRYSITALLVMLCFAGLRAQTVTVTGTVTDGETGQPLVGVNVAVMGTINGTISDQQGKFSLQLSLPAKLRFTYIGYTAQVVDVTTSDPLTVALAVAGVQGEEVVVSASRIEETVLVAPVSIEKMDALAVAETPAINYYQAIANLKQVDVATSSIGFQIINSRGFGSTGNTRFIQLIDGMDSQAPGLNFPIGNLNGPSELDIESVELIPGASSALYGPAAFNGAILMNSKSPFQHQGLSAYVKVAFNHVGSEFDESTNFNRNYDPVTGQPIIDGDDPVAGGEYQSISPIYEMSVRYAKAFNDRFAFKVNFTYFKADDWQGVNFNDLQPQRANGLPFNPGYDGVHILGDNAATNIGDLKNSQAFLDAIDAASPGGSLYASVLPNDVVSRTGYWERDVVDYGAENIKINTSLHYRLNDQVELLANYNGGFGTTVYTGLGRYSLRNFAIHQGKLEARGTNWFVRLYTTIEDDGDSYIADFLANGINEEYLDNNSWFGAYGGAYLGYIAGLGKYNPGTPATAIEYQDRLTAHVIARQAADVGRFLPGTPEFEQAKENVLNRFVGAEGGASFDDKTGLYHAEGQYNFEDIGGFGLTVGASYRIFALNSNGTVFDDANRDINFSEYGVYAQASRSVLDDRLKLQGSLRYDKNENFEGQINPRISAVFSLDEQKKHNLRAAYQTGFRFPTTQGQYINLNLVAFQLVGGLAEFGERFIADEAYTLESINRAIEADDPSQLQRYEHDPVKPEQVQSIEVGYKGVFEGKLFVDLAYYYSAYTDFVSQIRVRNAPTGWTDLAQLSSGDFRNTTQIYTNSDQDVNAQGFAAGFDYRFSNKLGLGLNYNWNKLEDIDTDELLGFNTPEHKFNVSLTGRRIADNFGFSVAYRWQDAFAWESSFAVGDVAAFGTIDAQVSYRVPSIRTIVKLGGQNILNQRYFSNLGSPELGAQYYISLTYNELFN